MAPSIWQILLVVLVVVVLFGAGRLPRLMGDMAKGIKSFKQGMKEGPEVDADTGNSDPDRIQAHQTAEPAKDKDRAANT